MDTVNASLPSSEIRHCSWIGIAGLIASVLAFLSLFGIVFAYLNGVPKNLTWLLPFVAIVLIGVGMGLDIASLTQTEDRKIFAILGLVGIGLTLLSACLVFGVFILPFLFFGL